MNIIRCIRVDGFFIQLEGIDGLLQLVETASHSLSIHPSALILMHRDGSQIDTESLFQEVLQESSSIDLFCFNREHLSATSPAELEAEYSVSASTFLPPLLGTNGGLQAYKATADTLLDSTKDLLQSLRLQRCALGVALKNLEIHQSSKQGAAQVFELFASPLLQTYSTMLQNHDFCISLIQQIKIHPFLDPPSHNRQPKERVLASRVALDRMAATKEGCAEVFYDMQDRSMRLNEVLEHVAFDTAQLQAEYREDSDDDLAEAQRDARYAHSQMIDVVRRLERHQYADASARQADFNDLAGLEADCRQRVLYLIVRKNNNLGLVFEVLAKLADLQCELQTVPETIKSLNLDLKTKCDNFKHLARLQSLIPTYVATMCEIARRRTYFRAMLTHSSNLANAASALAANENKKRAAFRTAYGTKQSFFEVAGLEDGGETLEIELRRHAKSTDAGVGLPDIKKEDLEELGNALYAIEKAETGKLTFPAENAPHALKAAQTIVQSQLKIINAIESDFQQLALAAAREDVSETDEDLQQLRADIRQLEETNENLARELQHERGLRESHEAETSAQLASYSSENARLLEKQQALDRNIRRLAGILQESGYQMPSSTLTSSTELERLFDAIKAGKDSQQQSKILLTDREGFIEQLQRQLLDKEAEVLTQRSSSDAVAAKCIKLEDETRALQARLRQYEEDGDVVLRSHRRALTEVESQVTIAQTELEAAKSSYEKQLAFADDARKRDQAQSAEQARIAGDRATAQQHVIDQLNKDLKQAHDDLHVTKESQKTARDDSDRRYASLRNELKEASKEISAQQQALDESRRQLAAVQQALSTREQKADTKSNEAKRSTELPVVDRRLEDAILLIISALQSWRTIIEKMDVENEHIALEIHSTATALQANLGTARVDIEQLSNLSDRLIEIQTSSTRAQLAKWQRESKTYRNRAKAAVDKIAFRHFKEGDLALFLPTKNTSAQIWAAFNSGYPHYFLSSAGPVAEQMRSREWIVARIKTMTEHVVNPNNPSSNPFGLTAGVRYWVLETEQWSPSQSGKLSRRSTDPPRESLAKLTTRRASEQIERSVLEDSSPPKSDGEPAKIVDVDVQPHVAKDIEETVSSDPFNTIENDTPSLQSAARPSLQDLAVPEKRHGDEMSGDIEPDSNSRSRNDSAAFLPLSNVRPKPRPRYTAASSSRVSDYASAKRAFSQHQSDPAQSLSPAPSEAFTYTSIGSVPLHLAKRRQSTAGSNKSNSTSERPSTTSMSKATSTLASSILSVERDDTRAVPIRRSFKTSSPSIDLLRRFSRTVESVTGQTVKGAVT